MTRDRELPLKRHMPALEESVRNPISMDENAYEEMYKRIYYSLHNFEQKNRANAKVNLIIPIHSILQSFCPTFY